MTLEELSNRLVSTGLPTTYRAWPENAAPSLPWICYLVSYSNNFAADGQVYFPINHIQIELYTKLKDPEAESKVETALHTLFWEKTETYLESQKCFKILYEIEV